MKWIPTILLFCMLGALQSACVLPVGGITTKSTLTALPISPEGRWHDLEVQVTNWMQKRSLPEVDNPPPRIAEFFSRRWLAKYFGIPYQNLKYEEDKEKYGAALDLLDQSLRSKHKEKVDQLSRELLPVFVELMERGKFYTTKPELKVFFRDEDGRLIGPNTANLTIEFERGRATQILRVNFLQEYQSWQIDEVFVDGRALDPLDLSNNLAEVQ